VYPKLTVTGVGIITALDGDDAGPVPMELLAVTVKVYESPSVRPVTVQFRAPAVMQV
jgi:hypothetical protein